MKIHFESALLIAIAPAIITSLIDGMGEWSNSRNYKRTKALEAIKSFRLHVEREINVGNDNYYENLKSLDNKQLQQIIIFLNQWSVYITEDIASKEIIKKAVGYEVTLCLYALRYNAYEINRNNDINGYFSLLKHF